MLLKLQYNESISHPVKAAFIRGSSPEVWLREISRWNIPVQQLDCFVMPESIQSVNPAGLFVILKGSTQPEFSGWVDLYGMIGNKLFLPVHAQLFPEVDTDELNDLILWEQQVFHPTIGLVGFSPADSLDLTTLLQIPEMRAVQWNLAHPGIPQKPSLQQINVLQPSVEEVIDSFKELIDPKALKDIIQNQEEKSSLVKDLFTNLNQGLLTGALSVIQKIKEGLSSGNDQNADSGTHAPGSGLFDRLENWIKENLEDLQRKRDNEIQRLLNLFDENTDEALKYAIPLDSPYLNRGTSSPTSQLSPHSTDFDITKLGGGGTVDSWSVDSYYYDLRRKYQHAAQKEIEARNFKKAAYIYAHLLGDFYAAAKVLEQGKFYREAAALYKDHLKNKGAAAECLERGGLLLESIELYDQLQKHEKVGDLYHTIGQKEQASQAYQRGVESVLRNGDYLEGARIQTDKLAQPDKALQTLLEGWNQSNQAEPCLKRYFDLLATTPDTQISQQIEDIFENQTPKSKKTQLLNVLVQFNDKHHDPEILETSTQVAYQIISEQVHEGNHSNLLALRKFLPEDHLVASDVSRFTNLQRNVSKLAASSVLQLDRTIEWVNAISHRNQFLAIGIKDRRLHLARGNWYGNFEYYSWDDKVNTTDTYNLVADSYYSNRVVLLSSNGIPSEEKVLLKNKYFDEELIIDRSYGSSKGLIGLVFNKEGGISMLKAHNYTMTLYHYHQDGSLKSSTDCTFISEGLLRLPPVTNTYSPRTGMFYRNGQYYAYRGNMLMKISEDGTTERGDIGTYIGKFAVTPHHTRLKIAIATDNGCFMLRQIQGELKAGGNFFAQDVEPNDIQFISANSLVVTAKNDAQVYLVGEDNIESKQTFQTRTAIVATLPTASRHEFALLEETGKISVCKLEFD